MRRISVNTRTYSLRLFQPTRFRVQTRHDGRCCNASKSSPYPSTRITYSLDQLDHHHTPEGGALCHIPPSERNRGFLPQSARLTAHPTHATIRRTYFLGAYKSISYLLTRRYILPSKIRALSNSTTWCEASMPPPMGMSQRTMALLHVLYYVQIRGPRTMAQQS